MPIITLLLAALYLLAIYGLLLLLGNFRHRFAPKTLNHPPLPSVEVESSEGITP